MENILLKLLKSDTETEVLEFKEAKNQYSKDKLGKYFSALCNEANLEGKSRAWLLFGVGNDKSIVGTNITDEQLNDYKNEISNHTSPIIGFVNIHRINSESGTVLMLEIPSAPKGIPVSWKGHYYGRNGESLGALNSLEYDRIRKQNTSEDWSAKIIKKASIDDLSSDAILMARVQYAEKNPKHKETISNWNDTTFLNKAKICINGQITYTAILLLGKSESEHFINPSSAKITWILKDRDNIEKDYAHFSCPLFLEVENVFTKIRNLKYRYLQSGTLFPDEVDQFEPYIIREAINNCIAHQDYTLGGKINVVEREDGILTFVNAGSFIPGSVEKVIEADAPETEYRNPFLANAMVNLNMIDTIGSGIKKMFVLQKNKYFPLPDYDLSGNKVKMQIIGKIVDVNYARKLAQLNDLNLQEIVLLDKIAKDKPLLNSEIKKLKKKKLIEGRKPNFHISVSVAKHTNQKDDYIKLKGINDNYAKKIIIDYLKEFNRAKRSDFVKTLLVKLPDILNDEQKKNKIKNYLQDLRKEEKIINIGKYWEIAKN